MASRAKLKKELELAQEELSLAKARLEGQSILLMRWTKEIQRPTQALLLNLGIIAPNILQGVGMLAEELRSLRGRRVA